MATALHSAKTSPAHRASRHSAQSGATVSAQVSAPTLLLEVLAPEAVTAPRKEKSLVQYLVLALSIVLLAAVLAIAVLVIVIPKATNSVPLTVLTPSMVPHFPPGTLVIDKKVNPSSLRIGDIATYQIESGKPAVITHRIVAINNGSNGVLTFVFKGDNNAVRDPSDIMAKQIQGKVWYSLPVIGYVSNWMNGGNRGLFTIISALVLFAYTGYTVVSAIVGGVRKKRGSRPRSSPDQ
jgi:signal peptidase